MSVGLKSSFRCFLSLLCNFLYSIIKVFLYPVKAHTSVRSYNAPLDIVIDQLNPTAAGVKVFNGSEKRKQPR